MAIKNLLLSMLKKNTIINKLHDHEELLELIKIITKNLTSEFKNIVVDNKDVTINFKTKGYIYSKPINPNLYYFAIQIKKTQKIDRLLYDFYHLMYLFFVDIKFKEIRIDKKIEFLLEINCKDIEHSDIIKTIKQIFISGKRKKLKKKKEMEGK